eukprot:TRINITY_DN3117_c1_g1_i3.p1 TRINITY_DN3117_c1_g1~~TRINITY_DN3117_c1_g1_i3.p1  ORF type:complete len:381 (-),score=38.26 TRINITY_DN3117_c1_g1_i3:114-1256(-)
MSQNYFEGRTGVEVKTSSKHFSVECRTATKELTLKAKMPFEFKPDVDGVPYYFEIHVTKVGLGSGDVSATTIAIGMATDCNTIFAKQGILPGWVQGSWGMHSDDGHVFLEEGAGTADGATFRKGDTVGCGLTCDGALFFTKNGRLVKVFYEHVIGLKHKTLFAALGVENGCAVESNFGERPFAFDVRHPEAYTPPHKNPSLYVQGQKVSCTHLPELVWTLILESASVRTLSALGQVSRDMAALLSADDAGQMAWKAKCMQRWPHITLKSANWHKLYVRRYLSLKEVAHDRPFSVLPIENCVQWEFKCPIALDKLSRTKDMTVDFCSECKEHVYLVTKPDALEDHVQKGHCVAIDFDSTVIHKRKMADKSKMRRGKLVVRR